MPLFPLLKSPAVIGMDIADDKIRLIKLQRDKSTIKIDKFTSIDLPKEAIKNSQIRQAEAVITQLNDQVKQWKMKGQPVAIALPSHCVVSKRIKLPIYLKSEDYETEIALHLNQYLPEMDEALYFDFMLLGKRQEDYQEVLLFAARQVQVDAYVNMVNQTGLLVKIVDIDFYALVRAVQWSLDQDQIQWDCAGLLYFYDGIQFIVFNKSEVIVAQSLLKTVSFISQMNSILQAQSLSMKQLDHCFVIGDISLLENDLQKIQDEMPSMLTPVDLTRHPVFADIAADSKHFLVSLGLALRSYPS